MATTSKKAAKKSKPKPRAASSADAVSKLKKTIAAQAQEIREGAEQQTATSEILRMIARSPGDLQLVLDTIAESAATLCDAEDAAIFRVDGSFLRLVAHFGPIPMADAIGEGRVFDRGMPPGRAIIDRQTVHVPDLRAAVDEFPGAKTLGIALGLRTVLSTPLLRDGVAIGAIHIRRREVSPFSDRQIKLLETFADQAVIAIENVRLFQELTEALERQTATSEILGVIASSPTDIQPVLDTVVENAARVCGANDAVIRLVEENLLRAAAHYGPVPEVADARPINRQSPAGRAVLDRAIIHIPDWSALPPSEYPEVSESSLRVGIGTALAVPLMRESVAVGGTIIQRTEVRPFTEKQIALLGKPSWWISSRDRHNRNVRLFKELQERNRAIPPKCSSSILPQAKILCAIASPPTDPQPVFDAIVGSAARLCDATFAALHRFDGQVITFDAHHGMSESEIEELPPEVSMICRPGHRRARPHPGSHGSPTSTDIRRDPGRPQLSRWGKCRSDRAGGAATKGRQSRWRDGPVAARGSTVL